MLLRQGTALQPKLFFDLARQATDHRVFVPVGVDLGQDRLHEVREGGNGAGKEAVEAFNVLCTKLGCMRFIPGEMYPACKAASTFALAVMRACARRSSFLSRTNS